MASLQTTDDHASWNNLQDFQQALRHSSSQGMHDGSWCLSGSWKGSFSFPGRAAVSCTPVSPSCRCDTPINADHFPVFPVLTVLDFQSNWTTVPLGPFWIFQESCLRVEYADSIAFSCKSRSSILACHYAHIRVYM